MTRRCCDHRLSPGYTSSEFARFCADNQIKTSAGRTGVCWDNAGAESFLGEHTDATNGTKVTEAAGPAGAAFDFPEPVAPITSTPTS